MRAQSNATLARPYIARLRAFRRLIWPSVWPLLHWLDHGVADRVNVDHQCPCEIHDRWNSTTLGIAEPRLKLLFITAPQQALKANGQTADHRKARHFMLQDREHSDLALCQQRSRLHADRCSYDGGNAQAGRRIKRHRSDRPFSRRGRSVGSGKASDMCNVAGQVSERALVAELLRLIEQPPDLRHTFAHQVLQRRMKPHWRGRFRVALEPLGKRFEPNPFVHPPSIDAEMSGDIRQRPALAALLAFRTHAVAAKRRRPWSALSHPAATRSRRELWRRPAEGGQ